MNRKLYIGIGVLLCGMMAATLQAQNTTSSPSSRFGYGEIKDNVPVAYRSMGGAFTGLRSNRYINPSQPASYTACDSTSFLFDIAGAFMWTNYSDENGHRNLVNGNLQYVNVAFPVYKQWIAFSAGVSPYTSMGYSMAKADSVGGHVYAATYAGLGGISQIYGGLSFNICNWVALGANFYYMFGQIANTSSLIFTEDGLASSIMYKQFTANAWRFRYGIQFFHTFAEKHTIILGGTFENKRPMGGEYLQYELNTVDSVKETDTGFESPMFYSAGLSYCYNQRLTIAADYTCQCWSQAQYFGNNGKLKDRQTLNLGVEYRHNPMGRNYAQRMMWRAGVKLINSYVTTNNKMDFTVSAGFGLPFRTSMSMVNVSLEYERRNSMANIYENCLQISVDAAINENWFFKRRL